MCLNDRECIRRCLAGEAEEFRHLVARYQGPLVSYLAGKLGSSGRAEEAAQETFVRAYFGLSKLEKPESFLSWLIGIALRVLKEEQRLEHQRQVVARMWAENRQEPECSNDYALERAVGELNEPYRQIVLMRYYSGSSCTTIAEQLGMPLGTVTKYLSRAYAMLRESLQSQESRKGSEVEP
jgi:RNA polymerase sigma-70 factor, ECF subfamily